MQLHNLRLLNLPKYQISKENFKKLLATSPRRLRFSDKQADPIKISNTDGKYTAFVNVRFEETIGCLLQEIDDSIRIFRNPHGFGIGLRNPEITQKVKEFIHNFNRLVFLKSLLGSMVALDMNFESNREEYTDIGRHEHLAKEFQNNESLLHIASKLTEVIQELPFYREADCIMAIPPTTGKDHCFPRDLAQLVAQQSAIPDYSSCLNFIAKHASLKDLPIDEKWQALVNSNLVVEPQDAIRGKVVILLDDLYQSGTTVHFVAMKLLEAGAQNVLGLAVVKCRSDDDNIHD